jgi:hypothetical protein
MDTRVLPGSHLKGQRSPAAAQNRTSIRLAQRLLDGLFEC